jgi:hypothetical protein
MAKLITNLGLAAFVLAQAYCFGQTRRVLEVQDSTPIQLSLDRANAFNGKCDVTGNLYIPEMIDSENNGQIIRFSKANEELVRFSLSTTDKGAARLTDFALDPSGDLIFLTGFRTTTDSTVAQDVPNVLRSDGLRFPLVATFNRDGKQLSEVRLSLEIVPMQLSVLRSGDWIIAGLARIEKTRYLRNFLGVFRSDGQLIREVKLPPEFQTGEDNLFASAYSTFEMGDDGSLFLVRMGSQGPIHVISPDGEVIQTIQLAAPPGTRLLQVRASRGRLLARTGMVVPTAVPRAFETRSIMYTVIDPQTGEIVAQYDERESGVKAGMLVCFTPDSFTFLIRNVDGGISLVQKQPR